MARERELVGSGRRRGGVTAWSAEEVAMIGSRSYRIALVIEQVKKLEAHAL